MEQGSTTRDADGMGLFAGEAWFDPIEAGIRDRVRGFIQELLEQELTAALGRSRCERAGSNAPKGYRNGTRERQLLGSFGPVALKVPRARMAAADGGTGKWRSASLPRHARKTRQVAALVAGACLAGANTRRVKRALAALFGGAVGKDVASRTWRKVKNDWEAWGKRDLADEDIVRLILDGTVVRVRLDRKATGISLLVVLGVRCDGQKVLLAVQNMGGESEAAWRSILDGLVARGLRTPEFLITDGAAGLERALAALWPEVPAQHSTVHKHRSPVETSVSAWGRTPDSFQEEVTADHADVIYADTPKAVQERPAAVLRKWRLRCPAMAASLEDEAAERMRCDCLFAFLRLPKDQWKSARTTDAIERLHEEAKRRIKTQTVPPSAEMLLWALMTSSQITMPKSMDGRLWMRRWPIPSRLTSPPDQGHRHRAGGDPARPFPPHSRRYRRVQLTGVHAHRGCVGWS